MRSTHLKRTHWSGLTVLLLLGIFLAPAWSQDEEPKPAESDPAPMAAAEEAPAKEAEHADEAAHPKKDEHAADVNHPHVSDDAPDEFHHDPHDLSHNDATDMLEAPHEPSLDLAMFTLLVFILLVVVLGKFAWSPILSGLKARENSMEGKMKKAEEMYEQANAKLAEYTRQLSEAQQEIKQMRDDAIKTADEKAKQIVEAAQQSASAERDRAIREIDAAKGAAINELAQASVNMAVDLAGQITRKELTPEDHANLIQDSISKLPSNN
ncbi:ATP synthase F0 subunit B [Blastopirellula marina]|uniref:ATP synthase subunit b n=1 Tax=Blastopirellula marina TaxID=124 RepID=A0A2S8FB64_9BACT|nr:MULTISPECIES: F0F1 ATP synthase subunit B [Pirellulaceae]PQO29174.1 ATP synthase F0 subunit B [Blastopirellula marina]RCS50367.1 ATP synthase F0 subunit B [Bremerella cremea]